jgi:hypothetical protein
MGRAASWLAELKHLTVLYFAAGLSLIPWGAAYAFALTRGWNSAIVGFALLAGGLLTASLAWNRLDRLLLDRLKKSAQEISIMAPPGTGKTMLVLTYLGQSEITVRVTTVTRSEASVLFLGSTAPGTYVAARTVTVLGARPACHATGKALTPSGTAAPALTRYARALVLQH